MSDLTQASPEERRRRRLAGADLTSEQRAAMEARRAERETLEYQEGLARDIDAYRREYPPVGDPDLIAALAGLRRERERLGLSLTDMAERTGIDCRRSRGKLRESGRFTIHDHRKREQAKSQRKRHVDVGRQ